MAGASFYLHLMTGWHRRATLAVTDRTLEQLQLAAYHAPRKALEAKEGIHECRPF